MKKEAAASCCGVPPNETPRALNRPFETFLNSMVRVPVYDDSVGIIITNSLPRNRNVSGNVALLINLRYLARTTTRPHFLPSKLHF